MNKGYLLLALFGLWCLVCALWYMFGVKGASTDLALFSPQPMLLAIIEILVMILGAFIIGFGVAWLMREPAFEDLQGSLIESRQEIEHKNRELTEVQSNADVTARRIQQAEEKILSLLEDNDTRLKELELETKKAMELEKKIHDHESKVKALDGDASSARFRVRLLENNLLEKESTIKQLVEELNSRPKIEHRDWSDHPFVRPLLSDGEEKDDLTEIKGIGPAFQRKLNTLDIFSFKQISEMSGEAVTRLAEAIEVFPDRIHRDNWIGQATRLYQKKLEG
jgi:predicted flap endonuclease-1-like 5' DNA nuclease